MCRCVYAIDLGTQNTVVYKVGEGIILNEPTYISIKKGVIKNSIYLGEQAKRMHGKTNGTLSVSQPLKSGAIADLDMSRLFISHLIKRINHNKFFKPDIAISIPHDLTQVERRAVIEAGKLGGAREVLLIEDPFSAIAGARELKMKANGYMIVDIGSGVSEVSLVSLGGIVFSNSIRAAGDELDDAIIKYLKNTKRFLISKHLAESIKIEYGAAKKQEKSTALELYGKDLKINLPSNLKIDTNEMVDAMEPTISEIINLIKDSIRSIPAGFAQDIWENGIILTGGTSLLKDIELLFSEELNLKVQKTKNPLLDIAIGAGKIIGDKKIYNTIKQEIQE